MERREVEYIKERCKIREMYRWHRIEFMDYNDGRIFTRKELPHEEMFNASERQIMEDTLREHVMIFLCRS